MSTLHEQLLAETREQFDPGSTYSPLDFDSFRAALRAAVELHAPTTATVHEGTSRPFGAYRSLGHHEVTVVKCAAPGCIERPPCSTIQAIARELGVSA